MDGELAYSFHLGSDKNKSKMAKKISKENVSGTTSLSNNSIQNLNDLSKVNKHNLRDYDNQKELINVIAGTDNLYNDVKDLYLSEFEEARIEYNDKQTRSDRIIGNYIEKISKSHNDLACEIIIELGDMDFWEDKDDEYRFKMIDVYNEQVKELEKLVPTFKIANATIHFDETSPHMHIVGVPVIENCKRGMKKQVGKSQLFTKELLAEIQDKMRNACIKSYNKFYDVDSRLKTKQKGRNQDINVKDMYNYKSLKKNLEKHNLKLKKANEQIDKLYTSSNKAKEMLKNLKPTVINKENCVISKENINEVNNLIEEMQETAKTISSASDLNVMIKEFESDYHEIERERDSLKYELELKNEEIDKLKNEISFKDKIIDKLQTEKEKIKLELQSFKSFWYGIMNIFHKRINYEKDEQYKYVSDDLHKAGVFSDDEFEIATNIYRKVKPKEDIDKSKTNKKNNMNLN